MKHFLSIFLLSFCLITLSAQEKHFVFIQSDNNQPFYVSVNGKLYSSTATGYVIIPKLTEGNYNFSIGFAQNAYPEQSFQFNIDKKDLGFNLKNFGEKGWGLFNLQSLAITMAGTSSSNDVAKALKEAREKEAIPVISFDKIKKDSTLVTDQTNSSVDTVSSAPVASTKETLSAEINPHGPVTGAPDNSGAKVDSLETVNPPSKSEATSAETNGKTGVKKVSELKNAEGVQLSYVDKNGKITDTVQITIPSVKSAPETPTNTAATDTVIAGNNSDTSTKPVTSASANKEDFKFLDVDMNTNKNSAARQGSKQPSGSPSVSVSGTCNNIATDDDYARLRKKMAGETTDEKMINEAKKYYKNKCFTTSQVKSLSTLFMSDEGRFRFFEASIVSVTDVQQYADLQSEFVDPAFVNRFKAMLQ